MSSGLVKSNAENCTLIFRSEGCKVISFRSSVETIDFFPLTFKSVKTMGGT